MKTLKTMNTLVCFAALTGFAGCALDDTDAPLEESQQESGLLTGSNADSPSDPNGEGAQSPRSAVPNIAANQWMFCRDFDLGGPCWGGPVRLPDVGAFPYSFDNMTSSIQTHWSAMETWNDKNFKGTYGFFAPQGTWNVLTSPYNDSISSISYPGV